MYYVLYLVYWFIVYINCVLFDYVWLCVHCMCMLNCLSVLCLECIVLFIPDICILEYVYCEEVNVKMLRFPFIFQPQGGRCQVCQALTKPPTIVVHLYSQPSAVRPASIFSSGGVLLFRIGLSPFTWTRSCVITLRLVLNYRRCDVSSVFPLYSVVIGLCAWLDVAIFVFANQVSWR